MRTGSEPSSIKRAHFLDSRSVSDASTGIPTRARRSPALPVYELCLAACLPACSPACSPALPACLPVRRPALPARLPARQPCLPATLLASRPNRTCLAWRRSSRHFQLRDNFKNKLTFNKIGNLISLTSKPKHQLFSEILYFCCVVLLFYVETNQLFLELLRTKGKRASREHHSTRVRKRGCVSNLRPLVRTFWAARSP